MIIVEPRIKIVDVEKISPPKGMAILISITYISTKECLLNYQHKTFFLGPKIEAHLPNKVEAPKKSKGPQNKAVLDAASGANRVAV